MTRPPTEAAYQRAGGGSFATISQVAAMAVACTHKSGSVMSGSLNVRFAPKATELLRRREMTRRAITGLMHRSNGTFIRSRRRSAVEARTAVPRPRAAEIDAGPALWCQTACLGNSAALGLGRQHRYRPPEHQVSAINGARRAKMKDRCKLWSDNRASTIRSIFNPSLRIDADAEHLTGRS